MTGVDAALCLLAVPAVMASAYLLLLAAFSARARPRHHVAPRIRFDVVVPAHDEEDGIAETVRSLLAVRYPASLRRVIVVADNCSDATADRARAAGAEVLVRTDPARRGKGYALATAFAASLAANRADAVVVVDADTTVSDGLLLAFAACLEAGASAVQGDYGVRNPEESWRTRLMAIAFSLFHQVRSLGRERLACSAGLRGNGMCFSLRLLGEVPHDAFSVVEDLEYGIRLGLAGHRVHFAPEARVFGDMVPGEEGSRSQRSRWEGGRLDMARRNAGTLIRLGVARRDRVLLDLAMDLLVPPMAYLGAGVAVGAALAAWGSLAAGRALVSLWVWSGCLFALGVYVTRGWWLSGTGGKGLLALLHAPIYLVWKLRMAPGSSLKSPGTWVRTSRGRRPS